MSIQAASPCEPLAASPETRFVFPFQNCSQKSGLGFLTDSGVWCNCGAERKERYCEDCSGSRLLQVGGCWHKVLIYIKDPNSKKVWMSLSEELSFPPWPPNTPTLEDSPMKLPSPQLPPEEETQQPSDDTGDMAASCGICKLERAPAVDLAASSSQPSHAHGRHGGCKLERAPTVGFAASSSQPSHAHCKLERAPTVGLAASSSQPSHAHGHGGCKLERAPGILAAAHSEGHSEPQSKRLRRMDKHISTSDTDWTKANGLALCAALIAKK